MFITFEIYVLIFGIYKFTIRDAEMSLKKILLVNIGVLLLLSTNAALSQSWPTKPVRVIVPYPPGGATDITARIYSNQLQKSLGQSFVIENKAGAGGEIGADAVAKSASDGYTLLLGAIGSLAIHAAVPSQKPPYDLQKDLSGISLGSSVPLAVAVRESLPVNNIKELIAFSKTKPDTLTYGSAGNGSTQHMTGEYFKQVSGASLVHVPYKGSAPAINDLLGGQIDVVFETLPALSAQINSGKIKILAVTSANRSQLLPEIPTLKEAGLSRFEVVTYYGLLAPADTPKSIIDKLSKAMQDAAKQQETQDFLKKQGAEAIASSPEKTNLIIKEETEKWARVAKLAKFE
jgi:tripartite-type tricarboxylate transporter receptor subunit TctC